MKKVLLSTVAVIVGWFVLGYVFHELLLTRYYEMSQSLWRPMEEVRWVAHYLAMIVQALGFAWLATDSPQTEPMKVLRRISSATPVGKPADTRRRYATRRPSASSARDR